MAEKEVLTREKAISNIQKIKTDPKKLEELFKDSNYSKYKKLIAQEWAPLILKKAKPNYSLTYDSISEGLEPIYFWFLDFMKDPRPGGLGLTVNKGEEGLEASASSGYFGETGARLTQMQKNASEYLGAINQVIKSILNLMYDLKEFEIRLKAYDKLKSKDDIEKREGEYELKGIWMDQVDIKKGKGSLNMLSQDLKFITIRDAFFQAESSKQIEEGIDLNERVKRILIQRYGEYEDWKKFSDKEIRKRYEIEKAYLKQQVGALKLYANWVKPYLKAAQKLKMKEFNTPHIVNAFSNIEMVLSLWGYTEVKPTSIHEKYENFKPNPKMFAAVQVNLHFRSVPQTYQGQGGRHYIHGGRVDMTINSYTLNQYQKEALELYELYEDMQLVDEWVGGTLEHMQEELSEYIYKEDDKKAPVIEKSKPKFENPFSGLGSGFQEIFGGIVKNPFSNKGEVKNIYIQEKLKDKTKEKADSLAETIYNTYKKTHGMLAW